MLRNLIANLLLIALLPSPLCAQPTLDAADRREVLENVGKLLRERYVDADAGQKTARKMLAASQQWQAVSDPKMFAKSVTEWLRTESGDGHLGLSYSEKPIVEGDEATFGAAEMQRYYGAHVNHGVERIERLPGNIMLLELKVFPPTDMGAEVVSAAMNVVAQGDALILDLRRNGGGADTANLVTGYLLDAGGQPLSGSYDRPTNKFYSNVSPAWVPGRRFGGKKPLYILVSRKTFSAAEAVAYDLQALKRAIIIGERTGGGAHPFEYRRVHPHFALDLPEGKSVNPITGGNWQGVGVKPDIEVAAGDALQTALAHAQTALVVKP